jgi:hypothetical protein
LDDVVETIEDPVLRAKAKRLLKLEDRRVRGVGRSTDRGDVGRIPWTDATIVERDGEKYLRTPKVEAKGLDPAPIRKRTDQQRVESLARRFWDTVKDNPKMARLVLQDIQTELWQSGRPITFEDLKETAVALLKKAAIEADKQERKRRGAL